MKRFIVLGALMAAAIAAPASAAIVFNVNGTFSGPAGGTLTGTFTTNDAITQVTAIDLFSSSNGAFQGYNYDNLGAIDYQSLPNTFRLTVSLPGHTDQLQLVFAPKLTTDGATIGVNSFEHQDFPGSGNRILSGAVTRAAAATGAVPEPATWAFMIGGLGLVGAALRRRLSMVAAA